METHTAWVLTEQYGWLRADYVPGCEDLARVFWPRQRGWRGWFFGPQPVSDEAVCNAAIEALRGSRHEQVD